MHGAQLYISTSILYLDLHMYARARAHMHANEITRQRNFLFRFPPPAGAPAARDRREKTFEFQIKGLPVHNLFQSRSRKSTFNFYRLKLKL